MLALADQVTFQPLPMPIYFRPLTDIAENVFGVENVMRNLMVDILSFGLARETGIAAHIL